MTEKFRLTAALPLTLGLVFSLAQSFLLVGVGEAEEKKTMSLLVPSSPGGSRDLFSRILAQYMPKYLKSKTSIIVKNMPGAGGDIMLNYLYGRAKADGSTIAHGTTSMYRSQRLGVKSARYKLHKFKLIGAIPENPYFFVIRGDHPVKSFSDLKSAKKPLFYGMSTESGGGTVELVGFTLKNTMGAKLKFVTGYRGSSRRTAAVLRGELDATLNRQATAEALLREGKLRVLLILSHAEHVPADLRGNAVSWSDLDLSPQVRQMSDFIITPSDLDKTFLAPPGVSAQRIHELRMAFDKTLQDPKVRKLLSDRGSVGPAFSGEDLQNKVVPRLQKISDSTIKTVKGWLGR